MKEGEEVDILTDEEVPPLMLKADVDKASASIDEIITYTVTVDRAGDVEVEIPEFGVNVGGLNVVEFGTDGPEEEDGRLILKKWYHLKADLTGSYIIPSLTLGYSSKEGFSGEEKTSEIYIEIILPGSEGERRDIRPLKPLERVPVKYPYIPWIIAVSLPLILLAFIVYYIHRKRKVVEEEIQRPAHELALEELNLLKGMNLIEKEEIKKYYFIISEVFRRYIERRYRVPAVEWTSEEIKYALKGIDEIKRQTRIVAERFFTDTDMVKFAKYIPGMEEVEEVTEGTYRFIEETKDKSEVSS